MSKSMRNWLGRQLKVTHKEPRATRKEEKRLALLYYFLTKYESMKRSY